MSSATPQVTVLVPARDEARWIVDCLASVVEQDFPAELIEVLVVVDASSTDGTDVVAKSWLDGAKIGSFEVVRNTEPGGTPSNLNIGLALARGGVVCRVDARSRIPRDYVRRCVDILAARPEVVVVGGAQLAIAVAGDPRTTGIARALNNRWGMGWSRYRRGAPSGPADTVYLGAFRRADLQAEGGWNRQFPTNQDFELNRRMAARGIVWYEAGLPVAYVPRAEIRTLFAQYRRFGSWKVRYWRGTGDRPQMRQLGLLVGVPVLGLAAVVALGITQGARRVALLAGLVGGAVLVEARGSHEPRGGLRVHARSAAALAAVGVGWLWGAWREIWRPARRD